MKQEKIIEVGISKAAINIIAYVSVLYLTVMGIRWIAGDFDIDSTDASDRSGMKLHVDHLTGCNYLSVSGGGITPRVGSNRNHYGCKGHE